MPEMVSRETHRGAFSLADAASAWRVESSAVDVFFVHVKDGTVNAPYKHVLRAGVGQLVFGVEPLDLGDGSQLELRAKGLPGYELRSHAVDALIRPDAGQPVASQVDDWVAAFTTAVVRDIMPVLRPDEFVSKNHVPTVRPGMVVAARRGVVWLSSLDSASYLGLVDADDESEWLPLTLESWLRFSNPTDRIVAESSEGLLQAGRLPQALTRFHHRILEAERLNRILAAVDDANLQMDRSTLRREDEERARTELKRLVEHTTAEAGMPVLHEALKSIGQYEGIEFRFPDPGLEDGRNGDPVVDVAINSKVRARPVRLDPDSRWWRADNGTLLGFRHDGSPVALLPGRLGRYRLRDPTTRSTTRVTRAAAATLHEFAWMFVRPLPERPVKFKDMLKLMVRNLSMDVARYALAGIAAALIAFAPAAMIALVVDWLVPARTPGLLMLAIGTLVLLAVIGLLVQISQGMTLLNAEGRVAARMTGALWDRLLRLRREHLRGFKSGEVAQRAFVFQELREGLSGIATATLSTILFLLPTMGLLYLYDPTLATASLALGLAGLGIVATFGLRQIKWQRRHHLAQQSLAGSMFQFVNGIEKLRAAGAESSVFAFWVQSYLQKKQAEIKVERLAALTTAASGSLPMFAAAFLFALVLLRPGDSIEVGAFLAVFAASMTFFAAVTRLGGSVGVVASVLPAIQHAEPLLEPAIDDIAAGKLAPVRQVQGDIRLDHVGFSYEDDGPAVLDDVSIHVRAGEFVAIVGESGAGKSTLLRLVLGLERPTTGAVYVDERNLLYLDDHALRRHIGVVAQNGSLQPGTILQNIVGITSDATLEDAWAAAGKASLADDIRAMEMGMFTPVGEHSGLFSGGQVQRILIAAAIVRNPSIVLLDEATNWLDNKSQSEVMDSVSEIAATRIVVAHRLSTIRNADRIYVVSQGKVVQSGTFEELADVPGLFHELIARQLT